MSDTGQAIAPFRTVETQRLDAFVDAAFAFAVSLLIIAGGEPLRSFDDLLTALARIPAFACGFALLMLFWIAHRTWSSLSPERGSWATLLSLTVVFSVLVFVFPLRLLVETATHFLSGGALPGRGLVSTLAELRGTYVIYGVGFAILSVQYALLFRQAGRALESADRVRRVAADQWSRIWWLSAATGLLSGGLAFTPLLATAPWLPGVTYQLIPAGVAVFGFLERRSRTRVAPAPA
jgi:uncharacterized membrane protein